VGAAPRAEREHGQEALRVGLALAGGHAYGALEAHRHPHEAGSRACMEIHVGREAHLDFTAC
jgi:hypothetical protein